MKPVMIGSPVYIVYRAASRLKIVCSTIPNVATHKMPRPYLIVVSGPTIHSPPPMAAASRIAPGPIVLNRLTSPNGNGSGRSARSHAGRLPWSMTSVEMSDVELGSFESVGWFKVSNFLWSLHAAL